MSTTQRRPACGRATSERGDPPRGRHVIEMRNLPCHVAREFDEKADDGDFAKGKMRASAPSWVIDGENDPMPVAIALPG